MKKLLLSALLLLSIGNVNVSAEEKPDQVQGGNIYNPNNYRVEYTAESPLPLLIPDYFIPVYKEELNPLEKYIPMYFHDELFPVCIERIYRYYYYDENNNKVYFDYGQSLNIYNINGKDYISIREEEDK